MIRNYLLKYENSVIFGSQDILMRDGLKTEEIRKAMFLLKMT